MADTLPQPVAREPLTRWEFATLFLQQQGKCAKCSTKLEKGNTIDEHLQPLDHLGTNDLSNRALYCKPCAKAKTKVDLAASWKGKRIRGETGNGPKRSIPRPPVSTLSKQSPGYRKPSWGRKVKV